MILVNIGFVTNFLVIWLKSWSTASLIVIPAIPAIGQEVRKLVRNAAEDTLTQEFDAILLTSRIK